MAAHRKILIVDDEKDFCRLMTMMLQREPFEIGCAFSIQEASQMLKSQNPSILLIDYNLPDGTGLDFVINSKESLLNAHIILITADPSPELKIRAKAAGVDFLAKPFGLKRIREIIRQVA